MIRRSAWDPTLKLKNVIAIMNVYKEIDVFVLRNSLTLFELGRFTNFTKTNINYKEKKILIS